MKRFLILILLSLTVNMLFSQVLLKNIPGQDSILISKKQFIYSSNALIELKNLKKQNYVVDERIRNKDVVISWYEKAYKKANESDSLSTILLVNKAVEIEIKDNLIGEYKREVKKQKTGKIVSSIMVPITGVLSFLLGWYLHSPK